jgi:cholest-4-en-3-one 26-monooxygenase
VPVKDRREIFRWTTQMADPEVPRDQKMQMMSEVGDYLEAFVRDRRDNPRDDLLSQLIQAEIGGDRLTDAEVAVHFMQLMAAGSESTRNSLARGMLELIADPAQQETLRRDSGLLGGAADECVRWQSPIMHQVRTVTRDVTIDGVAVREDERVVMWLIAGNRDEQAFENPDAFDCTRTARVRHLAFGGAGRHHCLGAQLARLELAIALDEILRRMPDMQLAGQVVRKVNNSFNGIERLPVRFGPDRRATAKAGGSA